MVTKRGIFERTKGSGIWWVRWTDTEGRKRREKAGTRKSWSAENCRRTFGRRQ